MSQIIVPNSKSPSSVFLCSQAFMLSLNLQVCSTSLKHIMQAPASTLHKLMSLGLKCKLDQSCLTLIIKCLADHLLPHFGGVDLYPDSQGGCFLLDYLLDVFEQVKLSMESGVVSFITSEEVGELRPTEGNL